MSHILSAERISFLFWAGVPPVIFEETLENCCHSIADSYILNVVFLMTSWFSIGSATGMIAERLRKDV
jgi:hypothetical protein